MKLTSQRTASELPHHLTASLGLFSFAGNQNAVAHLDPATPAESDAAMSSQSGAARPMRDVASGEQSASGGPPNQSTSAVLKDPKLGGCL